MATVQLKEPSLENLSTQKLAAVEEKYHQFKNQVVNEEKELSSSQTEKLKQFISQANQIKNKVQTIRAECEQQNAKLNDDINSRQQKLQGFQSGAKNYELEMSFKAKIAEEEKKYISNCQKRIQIAESINYDKLTTIDIDERKSIANEVFKWIIVAIYVEPQNKYYWPNFKDQVIEVKEALLDLKERLAKVSAFHAKEEQKVKTAKFLQIFNEVKKAPQLEKCVAEIQKIYEIATIFNECCEISKRVKGYEKQVEENRKLNTKEDDSLVQLRKECDALIEKYKLGELYLKQLTTVEKALTSKLAKYSEQAAQAEAYTAEMQGMTTSKLVRPLQPEKRDQCECTVY